MARLANEIPAAAEIFDAEGRRSDAVEFHPAYHHFMAESMRGGLARLDLARRTRRGARARRGGARGALLHGGAGRERAHVPGDDDARRGGGLQRRAPR